jgi:hypothetical protein
VKIVTTRDCKSEGRDQTLLVQKGSLSSLTCGWCVKDCVDVFMVKAMFYADVDVLMIVLVD